MGVRMENRIIDHLIRIAGKEGVLCTPEDLAVYSYDGTFAEGVPEVVVLPQTTEQTSEIVKMAAEARIPLIARGMGSGLAAGSIPIRAGGIVVSFTRMNRILEIDTAQLDRPDSSRSRHGRSAGGSREARVFSIPPILRVSGIPRSAETSPAMQEAHAASNMESPEITSWA